MVTRKTKNLREQTKARIAKIGINASLCNTDLFGIFKRFGYEKSLGKEIYRTLLHMDAIFGPDYTIETAQRLVGAPRSYGFIFPAELGKIYVIKYFKRMFKGTEDEKYLKGIKSYENNIDLRVRNLATQTLEELNEDESKITP